jgi:hypothetical protein
VDSPSTPRCGTVTGISKPVGFDTEAGCRKRNYAYPEQLEKARAEVETSQCRLVDHSIWLVMTEPGMNIGLFSGIVISRSGMGIN